MKRIISGFLCFLFLWQMLPVSALAEGSVRAEPTRSEILSVVGISGTADGAPEWVEGMRVSANMNGVQMYQWLNDFLSGNFLGMIDSFQDADVSFSQLEKKNPELYRQHRSEIGKFYDVYWEAMVVQNEINYDLEALEEYCDKIEEYFEAYEDKETDESDRAKYGCLIMESGEELKKLIREVAGHANDWGKQAERYQDVIWGDKDPDIARALNVIDEEIRLKNSVLYTTRAVPGGTFAHDTHSASRLTRLMPVSSALADTKLSMKIKVIDDKSFGIETVCAGQPVDGARIAVKSTGSNSSETITTDKAGTAIFKVANFKPDSDGEMAVDVEATREGYRKVSAPGLFVTKGSSLKVPLTKDDGKPYIYEWTYDGHDVLNNEYVIITSPQIKEEKKIVLKVTGKTGCKVSVWVESNKKKTYLEKDKSLPAGDQTLTYTGKYSCDFLGDTKLYAQITGEDGKSEKTPSMLKVTRAILDEPVSFAEKSSVFNRSLTFTMPSSMPQPLTNSKIVVDIPVSKLWPIDINISMAGSGYIYIGALDSDTKVKGTENWKNSDAREIGKLVKKAEEKGWFKQQRIKSGNDEAYQKKKIWLLGSIDMDMTGFYYGKLKYTKDTTGKGLIQISGGAAVGMSIRAEAKAMLWGVVYLGTYVTMNAIMGPSLGFNLRTTWPDGQKFPTIDKLEWSMGNTSISLMIRIELGVFVGLGVKGFASITATGYGFLSLSMRFGGSKKTFGSIQLIGGYGAHVTVQFLFFKWMKQIGDEQRYQLLPGPVRKLQSAAPALTLVERFIAMAAPKSAAAEQTEKSKALTQTTGWNADQIVEGTKKFEIADVGEENCEFITAKVDAKNIEYVFYTRQEGTYTHLYCKRADGTGNEQDICSLLAEKNPDSKLKDHHVADFTVQTVSLPSGTPQDTFRANDKTLSELIFVTMVTTKKYRDVVYEEDEGEGSLTMREPDTTDYCVVAAMLPTENGFTLPEMQIESTKIRMLYLETELGEGKRLLQPQTEHTVLPAINAMNFPQYSVKVMFTSMNGEPVTNLVALSADFDVPVNGPRAWMTRVAEKDTGIDQYEFHSITAGHQIIFFAGEAARFTDQWYALATKKGEQRRRLMVHTSTDSSEHRKGEGLIQLSEDGEDVLQYLYIKGKMNRKTDPKTIYAADDFLFYVTPDPKQKDKTILKQAVVHLVEDPSLGRNSLPIVESIERYDMEVNMPAATLHYSQLAGRNLIWWTESTTDAQKNAKAKGVWKIRGVWFNSQQQDGGNSMCMVSQPFTLAMIQSDEANVVPKKIAFTDDAEGKGCQGYYLLGKNSKNGLSAENAHCTGYEFFLKNVPGIDILGATMYKTIAAAGSQDDVLINLINTGNLIISGVEFGVYGIDDSSKKEKIETAYVCLTDSNKSKITVEKGIFSDAERVFEGNKAVRPVENMVSNSADKLATITGTVQKMTGGTESVTRHIKLQGMMPSTGTSFTMPIVVPKDWKTGTHTIELNIEKYYVQNRDKMEEIVVSEKKAGGAIDPLKSIMRFADGVLIDAAVAENEQGGQEDSELIFVRQGENMPAKIMRKDGNAEVDVTDEYDELYETDIEFDEYVVDTGEHDVELSYDLWTDGEETMVTLYVVDKARSNRSDNVLLLAYTDEEEVPSFTYTISRSQDGVMISDGMTWNFDLPLNLLTGGRSAEQVVVNVIGADYEEAGDYDNEVTIYLDPQVFEIVNQTRGELVLTEHSDGKMIVEVTGGRRPYTYQWQVKTPGGQWTDVETLGIGTMDEEGNLLLHDVTLDMDGYYFRCIVEDSSDQQLISEPVRLTVMKVPVTGDPVSVDLLRRLMIGSAALALAMLVLLRRRKEKEC